MLWFRCYFLEQTCFDFVVISHYKLVSISLQLCIENSLRSQFQRANSLRFRCNYTYQIAMISLKFCTEKTRFDFVANFAQQNRFNFVAIWHSKITSISLQFRTTKSLLFRCKFIDQICFDFVANSYIKFVSISLQFCIANLLQYFVSIFRFNFYSKLASPSLQFS